MYNKDLRMSLAELLNCLAEDALKGKELVIAHILSVICDLILHHQENQLSALIAEWMDESSLLALEPCKEELEYFQRIEPSSN
jgi:hypothetical protein